MDHVSLKKKLDGKLNESAVIGIMEDFIGAVSACPSSEIEVKSPKREKIISKASNDLYKFHLGFTVPFNDYGNSVILIESDMPVSLMIEEVARFIFLLELFYKEIKAANSVQELKAYYDQFKLKPKQLVDALMVDLELYSLRYGFEINKRDIAMGVNSFKDDLEKDCLEKEEDV